MRYLDDVFVGYSIASRRTRILLSRPITESYIGEEGYFGHGPINHEKVYEVPFVEGKIRYANYPPGN